MCERPGDNVKGPNTKIRSVSQTDSESFMMRNRVVLCKELLI